MTSTQQPTGEITPSGLVRHYGDHFSRVLPTHIRPDTWIRLAQGALRRGKQVNGRYELETAAVANPGAFLAALLEAARLGLEPGTEQYYLTCRKNKGQPEILGIVGYQGHIELMYRSGMVAAVIAEVVRENDTYQYRRGIDEVPRHEHPPFAGAATRGGLLGVYAYARLTNGAVSRVEELGRDDIARIRASSPDAEGEHSPWRLHEEAMWVKSAVRQLQKWVPTSPEFRQEIARATVEAQQLYHTPSATTQDENLMEGEVIHAEVADDAPVG